MTKKNFSLKKIRKVVFVIFFMSGIPHDLAQKTENVPKWAFFDNIWKNQKQGQLKAYFRQLLTLKMGMIIIDLFRPNLPYLE